MWPEGAVANVQGPPPADSPYRCQAKARTSQARCRRWALRNRKYCQFHGGRNGGTSNTLNMSNYYKQFMKETLRDRVSALLDAPIESSAQLYEELALCRVGVQDSVKLVSAAMENGEVKAETRALAFECMYSAIDRVQGLVLAISKLEKDAEDKISLRMLDLLIQQIIRAIARGCGDDEVLAKAIEAEIDRTVKLPKPRELNVVMQGTGSTPDQIVTEMDSSVVGGNGEST